MLIRDGRNEVHDVGPRRTFEPSMMRPITGILPEHSIRGTGFLFPPVEKPGIPAPQPKPPKEPKPKPQKPPRRRITIIHRDKKDYDKQYAAKRRKERTPEQLEAYREYQRNYMREWRRRNG